MGRSIPKPAFRGNRTESKMEEHIAVLVDYDQRLSCKFAVVPLENMVHYA